MRWANGLQGTGDAAADGQGMPPLPVMWGRLLIAGLGVWLVASPYVMGYEGPEWLNNQLTGTLVVILALGSLTKGNGRLRAGTLPLGIWLMLAPVLLGYHPQHIGVRSGVIGLAIATLALLGERRIREKAR